MDLAQPTYETMNHINAAIVQAMELCPRPELLTTKGAVLAALEWTRADPRMGSYHENLAGRVAFLASLMGETWKAHQQYKGARERNHADSPRYR